MLLYCCGRWVSARAASSQAEQSCENGEYHLWLAHARFIDGAAMAQLGEVKAGIEKMKAADQYWAAQGGVLTRSFYQCTLAEIQLKADETAAAMESIKLANDIVDRGERYYSPEVLRVKALILAAEGDSTGELLDISYVDAVDRGLYGLALRTAISAYEMNKSDRVPEKNADLALRLKAALTATQQPDDTIDSRKAINFLATQHQSNVISLFRRA